MTLEVLFDGRCPLCLRSMALLRRLDWRGALRYVDVEAEWPAVAARHPGLTQEACLREMHVVAPDGSVHRGFFAFRRLAWVLPLTWPLAPILHAPFASAVGPRIYRAVASRRARLAHCTAETCAVGR